MKTNWWNLKTVFDQEQFYKIIHGAEQHDYKTTIHTEFEGLGIEDVDDYTLQLYQEFEEISCGGSAYELIGYLYMNNVEVKCIDIMKKDYQCLIRSTVTKEGVYFDGGEDELYQMFRYLGIDPEQCIGEEITHTYVV